MPNLQQNNFGQTAESVLAITTDVTAMSRISSSPGGVASCGELHGRVDVNPSIHPKHHRYIDSMKLIIHGGFTRLASPCTLQGILSGVPGNPLCLRSDGLWVPSSLG
jgi:hypothetical protein